MSVGVGGGSALTSRIRCRPPVRRGIASGWGAAAALLFLLGGAARAQPPAEALENARARWQASRITSYELAYKKHCPCYRDEPATTIVTVTDGQITRVRYRHDGANEDVEIAADRIQRYWTVPDLFEVIAAALADRAVDLRATYEGARGLPTYLYLDYDRASVGDEIELRVSELAERP